LNILCLDDITASGRLKNHLNSPLEPDIARFGGGFDEPWVDKPNVSDGLQICWVFNPIDYQSPYHFFMHLHYIFLA
jgi:hypothetical protein